MMNGNKKLRVGSLFSGIGGIELGLERAGGFETAWFVEYEPYASEILKKHWPDVKNYEDITKINWEEVPRVDMLTGGFPCQDASVANTSGKGIKGAKTSLWKNYREAIRILRPRFIFAENVPNLLNRGFAEVVEDLASLGYSVEWRIISAASLGACHKRERLIVIAYPNGERLQGLFKKSNEEIQCELLALSTEISSTWNDELSEPPLLGTGNGFPKRVDRTRCIGNAVVPQVAQLVGETINRAK